MLPAIVPKARIAVYNYDSKWHRNAPQTRLQLCAEDLVQNLHIFRDGVRDRPIILIGHSLGGLVIQNALLRAKSLQDGKYLYLLQATKGFVALGAPFRGTKMQPLASFCASCMSLVGADGGVIRDLVYDNDTLRDLLHEFCQIRDRYLIPACCFFELYETDYGKRFGLPGLFRGRVVPESSACVDGWDRVPLQTDHLAMNKFSGPEDRSFISVSNRIREMCAAAKGSLESQQPCEKIGHWMVPFARNERFVGREAMIQQLLDRVPPSTNEDTCQRTALDGLGGIGKTQIALEIAYRVKDNYPDCSVFWIPAMTSASFETAYREIGNRLQTEGITEPGADVKTLVKQALSQSLDHWLLIVDNADDTELFFDGTTRLSKYFPSSKGGSILFTTRRSEFAVKCDIPGQHIITVPEMTEGEALALFDNTLNQDQHDIESIKEIVCLLSYLPLAVKQASAYVSMKRLPIKTYLEYCQSSEQDFLRLLGKGFEDTTRYDDSINPVAMTWMISFTQISRDSPLAAQFIKQICFLAERDIPIDLLSHGHDKIETDEAIGSLLGYAFVTRNDYSDMLQVHPLVRLAMQNWLEQQSERHLAFTITVQQLEGWLRRTQPKSIESSLRAMSHVRSVLAGPESIEGLLLAAVLDQSAYCWEVLGFHLAWQEFLNQRFRLLAYLLGPRHDETVKACHDAAQQDALAWTRMRSPRTVRLPSWKDLCFETEDPMLGLFDEDGLFGKEAVSSGDTHRFPEYSPDVFMHLMNTSLKEEAPDLFAQNIVSSCEGNLHRREIITREVSQEAFRICEEYLGAEHDPFIWLEQGFTNARSADGKYTEEFIHYIRETIKQWQNVQGPHNLGSIKLLERLHLIYSVEERYQEDVEIYRELLSAKQKALGHHHPRTIETQEGLADRLLLLGRFGDAEPVIRQLWLWKKKALGNKDSSTIATMAKLSRVVNNREEQHELLSKVALLQAEALPLKSDHNLNDIFDIAVELERQEQYSAAEQTYRKYLGLDPDMVSHLALFVMYRSAHVLEIQGKLEEAEQAYQRLLDLQQERLGASHSDTMMTLERLTELFKKQKRADRSEYTCRKLFRLQKKMLGPQNHKTLATLSTLGMLLDNSKSPQAQYVYLELTKSLKNFDYTCLSFSQSFFLWELGLRLCKREDYEQAEQVFRGYLLVGRSPEGFRFPTTWTKKIWLAKSLFFQEKYPEAELMFRDCLNLRERTRSIQDPEAMTSVYWLASSLFHQQKFSKAEEMYKDLLGLLEQGFLVDGLDKTLIAHELSHSLYKQQKEIQAFMVFLREAGRNPFLNKLLCLALLPFMVLFGRKSRFQLKLWP
jgi:tetratricopeptide (TPR) repeat protein